MLESAQTDSSNTFVERRFSDRILGFLGVSMMVGALYVFVSGILLGPPAQDIDALPAIRLLTDPAAAAEMAPGQLRFSVPGPFGWQSTGWGGETYHLHAIANGRELMPSREDIRPAENASYIWTFPDIPSADGSLVVRLLWSDLQHRPLNGTETDPVTLITP